MSMPLVAMAKPGTARPAAASVAASLFSCIGVLLEGRVIVFLFSCFFFFFFFFFFLVGSGFYFFCLGVSYYVAVFYFIKILKFNLFMYVPVWAGRGLANLMHQDGQCCEGTQIHCFCFGSCWFFFCFLVFFLCFLWF